MTRTRTITEKIETDHGSLYAHVQFDATGRACGMSFSTPGKHANTAVDDLIRRLGSAVDAILRDTGRN